MSEIVVRPLEERDLPAVIAGIASRDPDQHRRRLVEHRRHSGFTELIAWLDGAAVGFVGLGVDDDANPDEMVEAGPYGLVYDLHVEEGFRRRGVGRALMLELESRARAAGVPGVVLDTGTSEYFAPARALYASLGYIDQQGVYLGGWSDPDHPGVHYVDPLTRWRKLF